MKLLGKFPLAVEVVPFAYHQVMNKLDELKLNPIVRKKDNENYITDGQHYIIDLFIQKIEDPYRLEKLLKSIPGVIDTGLFLNIVDTIIIGSDNTVKIINR